MSRLKIDFETEDTNVVCELADMLRRLHGREGHECGRQPVGPFSQSMPVTAEELGFTNGVLPPNPFVAGVQLGNDLLPTNPFALDPLTPPGSFVSPAELQPPGSVVGTAPYMPPGAAVSQQPQGLPPAPFDYGIIPPVSLSATSTVHVRQEDGPSSPFMEKALEAGIQIARQQGVELDADGLPWDARIHSSSKGKLAKTGTWKLARNLDPALAARVTAELKAAMALPAPAARQVPLPPGTVLGSPANQNVIQFPGNHLAEVGMPADQSGVQLPPGTVLGGPAQQPAGIVPPPPVPQPAATPPPAPGAMTFPAFLVEITKQQAAKKLTFDEVMVVLKEHGLENLQLLTARPDLIPPVYSRLEAIWTSR